MFKLLDRYIGGLFLRSFLLSLTVLVLLFITIDFFTQTWRFDPDLGVVGSYYILKLPEIIYQMMPVSVMMGTLISLGLVSRTQELVAIQSSGINLFRTSVPLLVVSVFIALATFAIGDRLMPASSQAANQLFEVEIKKWKPKHSQRSIDLWYRSKEVVYNIQSILPKQNRIEGVTIFKVDENFAPTEILTAFSGEYINDVWILKKGKRVVFSKEAEAPRVEPFDELEVRLDETPEELANVEKQTEVMSTMALRRFIQQNKQAGFNVRKHKVVFYERFSFSFACVILVFLAIPFGVQRGKHGGFARDFGLCLVATFTYWACLSVLVSLGYNGTLPPIIAAWGANFIFMGIGYFLLRRTALV